MYVYTCTLNDIVTYISVWSVVGASELLAIAIVSMILAKKHLESHSSYSRLTRVNIYVASCTENKEALAAVQMYYVRLY